MGFETTSYIKFLTRRKRDFKIFIHEGMRDSNIFVHKGIHVKEDQK